MENKYENENTQTVYGQNSNGQNHYGPGVPDDSLRRIFDSFYRVDRARSSSGNGSGIGLAVAKEIILGHKGKIWAENRGGLAVIIQLPCFEEDEDGEDSDCGRR